MKKSKQWNLKGSCILPFLLAVNKSPLTVSAYMNLFDRRYILLFNYINQNSFVQFISTRIGWTRRLLESPDTYKLSIKLNQNTNEDRGLVQVDEAGTIIENKIKVFMVVYGDGDSPLRYVQGYINKYIPSELAYEFIIPLITDDTILNDSSIKITNMYDVGGTEQSTAYIRSTNCKATIHIFAEFDEEYGLDNMDVIIPGLEGYTLCNTYEVDGGLDFFVNFTDIIQTKISVEPGLNNRFTIKSVPVVKYSYARNSKSIRFLVDYLIKKKIYIDEAKALIDDQFEIDFKFFNTYGPSKMFTIGNDRQPLNKTNITLKFRMKVSSSAAENIKELIIAEIKDYIEEINEVKDMHISKLVTHLSNTFVDIGYIEFLGINDYDTTYQYIEQRTIEGHYIPEFLNINSTDITYSPDIQIDLV